MDTWNITETNDEAFALADCAKDISSLATGLASAMESDQTVLVWELCHEFPSAGRAVVQIPVTHDFFERFFNTSVGYRAMFRRGRRIGYATNAAIINRLVSLFERTQPESIDVILVIKSGDTLSVAGRISILRSVFIRSLDPSLAKVWYATQKISFEQISWLSSGISGGGKIDVGLSHPWNRIEQEPGDCFIELKGAFVGSCGLFQIKDPEIRAIGLSTTGAA